MFKHILVALDGSTCATHAFDLALALAKVEGARVDVCSVAEPIPAAGAVSRSVMEEALAEANSRAQRIVDEGVAKATNAGVAAKGSVSLGEPGYEIVEYARKIGADSIVLGTHGRTGLKRLFMGSVAEGVLRTACVPVVTVREEAITPPLGADEP
jgi:nucleotide-binding universal stress UspA family protein